MKIGNVSSLLGVMSLSFTSACAGSDGGANHDVPGSSSGGTAVLPGAAGGSSSGGASVNAGGIGGAPAPATSSSGTPDPGHPPTADAAPPPGSNDGGTNPSTNSIADLAYDSYTKLFYTVTNGKGYYVNNSGTATANNWWTQAELIEMAIDAYERKKSDAYKTLATQLVYGFVDKQHADWSYDKFNDDISWMVIASIRAHLDTGNADFLGYAKTNWDKMYARAWDTTYKGGGLWWTTDNNTKNACVNGPGAIGAYLLYKATGDQSYLTKATQIYTWERATLFDANTGAIYDNVNPRNGGDKWTFTYNTGTFIGIANYLYKETGDTKYLDDGKKAADFAKTQLSDGSGLIKESDITGDSSAFKSIMFRWLGKFMSDNKLEATYAPWLQYNANKAWSYRRASDNMSWNNWKQATPHMIFDSTGVMSTVEILQVVPPGGTDFAWSNNTPQNGRNNIEAENCDEKRGMTVEGSEAGGSELGGANNGAWARYENVDFTASAPTGFQTRASADGASGGTIEVHIDTLAGPLIGSCAVTSTGSKTTYGDFSTTLTAVTGAHDVYLAFKPSAGKANVGNINWFKLK